MVETLAAFFEANNFIVYSVYGQVFFTMGLAVALVRAKHSQLPLARSLWLLAGFGLTHAAFEWAFVFIPVQEQYMPPAIIDFLHILHYALGAFSYLLLLQFGVMLVAGPKPRRAVQMAPSLIFLVWAGGFGAAMWLMQLPYDLLQMYAEAAMRYALALPAALLTAYGLLGQARLVRTMDMPQIAGHLRLAAVAFAVYAVAGGLIVPRLDFPPAAWLNYESLLAGLGVPAAVFRSLCGLAIAYSVVRSLQIFDVETDRLFAAAERAQTLSAERERIGRDLHDGIIQSIYAAGLALEDASYTVEADGGAARAKIGQVMAALNGIVSEIRGYIYNLSMALEERDLATEAATLVERFRVSSSLAIRFTVVGEKQPLSLAERSHLLQILHEALSNVTKHARARRVVVTLAYEAARVRLAVRDDGVGFLPAAVEEAGSTGYRQGLRNMAERARELGAELEISSAPGRGTTVSLAIPRGQSAAAAAVPSYQEGGRG